MQNPVPSWLGFLKVAYCFLVLFVVGEKVRFWQVPY